MSTKGASTWYISSTYFWTFFFFFAFFVTSFSCFLCCFQLLLTNLFFIFWPSSFLTLLPSLCSCAVLSKSIKLNCSAHRSRTTRIIKAFQGIRHRLLSDGRPQHVQNAPDWLMTARAQSTMRWFPGTLQSHRFLCSAFYLLIWILSLLLILKSTAASPMLADANRPDFDLPEMYKCPVVCRCELILKKFPPPTFPTSSSSSLLSQSNYKVRSNCYRQRLRHLLWTNNLSNLTVQL